MNKTTPMTDETYVHYGGTLCPLCFSDELYVPDDIAESTSCYNCGASWFKVYKLIGYVDLCDYSGKSIKH